MAKCLNCDLIQSVVYPCVSEQKLLIWVSKERQTTYLSSMNDRVGPNETKFVWRDYSYYEGVTRLYTSGGMTLTLFICMSCVYLCP